MSFKKYFFKESAIYRLKSFKNYLKKKNKIKFYEILKEISLKNPQLNVPLRNIKSNFPIKFFEVLREIFLKRSTLNPLISFKK